MSSKPNMRRTVMNSLVNSLQAYGYPTVTTQNVLTDKIFREFSRGQLEKTIENAILEGDKEIQTVCEELIGEIDGAIKS